MQLTTPEIQLLNKELERKDVFVKTTFTDVFIFGRTYVVDYVRHGQRYLNTLVIRGNFHPDRFIKYWLERLVEIDGVRFPVTEENVPVIERFPHSEIRRIDDQFNLPGNFKAIAGWAMGSHYLILGTHQNRMSQVMFPRASKLSVDEGMSLSLEIGNYIRVEEVDDYDSEAVLDIDGYRITGSPDKY